VRTRQQVSQQPSLGALFCRLNLLCNTRRTWIRTLVKWRTYFRRWSTSHNIDGHKGKSAPTPQVDSVNKLGLQARPSRNNGKSARVALVAALCRVVPPVLILLPAPFSLQPRISESLVRIGLTLGIITNGQNKNKAHLFLQLDG
jgi:hypothetical protein